MLYEVTVYARIGLSNVRITKAESTFNAVYRLLMIVKLFSYQLQGACLHPHVIAVSHVLNYPLDVSDCVILF